MPFVAVDSFTDPVRVGVTDIRLWPSVPRGLVHKGCAVHAAGPIGSGAGVLWPGVDAAPDKSPYECIECIVPKTACSKFSLPLLEFV